MPVPEGLAGNEVVEALALKLGAKESATAGHGEQRAELNQVPMVGLGAGVPAVRPAR